MSDKVILGIDPGTTVMGYGVIEVVGNKPKLIAMGVLELHKYDDHYIKLGKIFARVVQLIESYKPTEMALEAPFWKKRAIDVEAGTCTRSCNGGWFIAWIANI